MFDIHPNAMLQKPKQIVSIDNEGDHVKKIIKFSFPLFVFFCPLSWPFHDVCETVHRFGLGFYRNKDVKLPSAIQHILQELVRSTEKAPHVAYKECKLVVVGFGNKFAHDGSIKATERMMARFMQLSLQCNPQGGDSLIDQLCWLPSKLPGSQK